MSNLSIQLSRQTTGAAIQEITDLQSFGSLQEVANTFKTTMSALFRIAKISLDCIMLLIIHKHTNLSN